MRINFVFLKTIVPGLTVLVAAVLLFWVVFSGLSSGKNSAQAETVLKNAGALVEGLDFFYSDQSRFPSSLEFANTGIMLNYFTKFPPADLIAEKCAETYAYKNFSAKNYELGFCLPKKIEDFPAGWNRKTFSK